MLTFTSTLPQPRTIVIIIVTTVIIILIIIIIIIIMRKFVRHALDLSG
jgi:hypothetical protein